jgi:hypothetical protein
VRYNQDAQSLKGITALGPPGELFGPRQDVKDIINGPDLLPSGATSIGDGIFSGRDILTAAPSSFDVKALVVMTDGKENRERWIADVAPQIDEFTYSVGLGRPENTSAPALQALSGNHGGYLLVTGPITSDNRFILQKYFLQILAGLSNAETVLDPDGLIPLGREVRVPFTLSDADSGAEVILLTPNPQVIDFRLETPTGQLIEPWRALAEQSMAYVISRGVSYYRLVLPTELLPARFDQAGTWHALLSIGRPRVERPQVPDVVRSAAGDQLRFFSQAAQVEAVRGASLQATVPGLERRSLPFSLLVHSYSNISLRASLRQASFEPGTSLALFANLAESGVPFSKEASVWAEVVRPDGSSASVTLDRTDQGQYEGAHTTTASGIYRFRVRGRGRTRLGHPFEREQTMTAAVWAGGDRDADPSSQGEPAVVGWLNERDRRLCELLDCLLGGEVLSDVTVKRLLGAGVNLEVLRKCLREYCAERHEGSRQQG